MPVIRKLSDTENTETFGRQLHLILQASQSVETSLRRTVVAYSVACDTIYDWVLAHPDCRTYVDTQQQTYRRARMESGLPAQLCISAIREVVMTLNQPDKYVQRGDHFWLEGGQPPRDFRLLDATSMSLSTMDGRLKVRYTPPLPHASGWYALRAKLIVDEPSSGTNLTFDIYQNRARPGP